MDIFLLKRRLRGSLVMLAVMCVAFFVGAVYFSASAEHGLGGAELGALCKILGFVCLIFWIGCLFVSLCGERIVEKRREMLVCGRAETGRDALPEYGNPPATPQHFFSGKGSIVFLVIIVVGLTGGMLFLKIQRPSPFDILVHGTVVQLTALVDASPETINENNKSGLSLLMVAIETGRSDMIDYLLSHGANLHAQDRTGRTALVYALEQPELVERLLKEGADLNHADKTGAMPIHLAIGKRNKKTVGLLVNHGARLSALSPAWNTPLFMAVENDFDVVDILLSYGADPEVVDFSGETPLHCAARCDNLMAARALVLAGAERVTLSRQGWSPLHLAAMHGAVHVATFLLESGVDVDIVDKRSLTPMSCAIYKNNPMMVDLLLEKDAKVNHVDTHGNTYLHNALFHEHYEICKKLIRAGIGVDASNAAGITARKLILEREHLSLLDAIENKP